MNIELNEIIEKYKLTSDEHENIQDEINRRNIEGKIPQITPVAIIDMAPPGSGKTGLNGYALKQLNKNLIIVNNDELRPFHPKADEISRTYPAYYNKITNEESKYWTDALVDKAIEGRYNFLYEGTGRKIGIFNKMIAKLEGYKIIIRAMAVNELNCLMSIIERYEGQVERKGWGRIVALDTFYKAYNNEMLDTVNSLEKNSMIDSVEVYIRGEKPTEPIRIYNSNTKEYVDGKTAIICGRERDKKNAYEYYKNFFIKNELKHCDFAETKEIISKIEDLYKNIEIEEISL